MNRKKLKNGHYLIKNSEVELFARNFLSSEGDKELLRHLKGESDEDIAVEAKRGSIASYMMLKDIEHSVYESTRDWLNKLKEWRHLI